MNPTRREILRLGLGSSPLLACGAAVPTFLVRSARAVGESSAPPTQGRILVVIQLDGGNDGLNTVVPYRDDVYHRARPTLHLFEKSIAKIDDRFGLHPSARGFSRLLEKQQLAVVHGVGYPNPNRSHLESLTIWQTARLEPDAAAPGWLARSLDERPAVAGDSPALHVHDAFPLPRALAGGSRLVPSIDRLEQFRRRIGISDPTAAARQRELLDRLARRETAAAGSLLQFVERTQLAAQASSDRLEAIGAGTAGAGYFESYGLARRLRLIAQLIKAGLSTSIYYTQLGGFDTHADQSHRHSQLLNELGESTRAFLDDLDKAGAADRVLILIFSEFGRRLEENAGGGTDHGAAAPVFVLGKKVRPGLHGEPTDLNQRDEVGDPRHAIDFRRVYATLLGDWLGVSAASVLGANYATIPLIQS